MMDGVGVGFDGVVVDEDVVVDFGDIDGVDFVVGECGNCFVLFGWEVEIFGEMVECVERENGEGDVGVY